MESIATGVDLVEIERFAYLNPKIKERFLRRVYTKNELKESNQTDQHLAGLFAAKEAAAKALGCGIGQVSWQDMEILNDSEGKPVLQLFGPALSAAQKSGWLAWSVSISHTRLYALASVTALISTAERKE